MVAIPSWAWRWIGYGLLALTVIGVGIRIGYIWQHGQVVELRAQKAAAARVERAQSVSLAHVTQTSQHAEAAAQGTLRAQATRTRKAIVRYVHDPSHPVPVPCVSWGMLRLHDAAVAGVDPGDLVPPPGEPTDACSSVKTSDFMATIVDNYAAARENAEQLDALEADINARVAALLAPDGTAVSVAP